MRFLLVDGYYYAFRSFYAMPPLSTKSGEPTNAIYGLTIVIRRMLADLQPDFGAVAFDGGLPADRIALRSDYKANRPEIPNALKVQIPWLKELLQALGLTPIEVEGQEADDVIATYTKKAIEKSIDVVLATNDKDLLSLIGPHVRVYTVEKKKFKLITEKDIEEKWLVHPWQLPDLLALTGDSVDNIPGVPGIGKKTAAKWISRYGSLSALLSASDIPDKRFAQLIEENKELILTNYKMLELKNDIPLPLPIEELRIKPNYAEQERLFKRFEFKKLAEALKEHPEKKSSENTDILFG
ncbi:flap endonuclease [Candidatus Methylacidiphilum fumarolicum]|uniref:5'-3' exonuclease n=2 Tax=Candidatus Methylacidiphilum fumarolicum TaxID=591154 RepID=I0JVX0_METFB|nr:5'-3' exonuclease H3TH domain-containing protein [Candidatus Methylacidiphilum fumarolicum]MBW6415093.1 flap endonuclease [Candidatus Methylacidiphilum fumarolicum]TFE67190.1 5'-3' exonuclease [Candidatus Methylacidiphilum fumarolicum]TFE72121.1 flap endonuclease [Candidatus Methylacidiphilum fumarolicum]TFE73622.1 flap endonuclease [Candidatus Methylacidiphilum fumarolicum]TFE76270.1 5'-3' exonuclease [Candidatus Methylacidiphilum fumarolicum]